MKKLSKTLIGTSATLLALAINPAAYAADSLGSAVKEGKVYGDFRLRYENVAQDNDKEDADALTLRSRVGFKTDAYKGFSALIEVENSTALVDDYNDDPRVDDSKYSTIVDPDHTEIDQLFLNYKGEKFSAKLGRQVLTLDGHRHVGHVGWRQDRQTFDALTVTAEPVKNVKLQYSYIDKRNRIFANDIDIDSSDHLINASYKTDLGKLTAYAYLLEESDEGFNSRDTFGASFSGATTQGETKFLYTAEYAFQEVSKPSTSKPNSNDGLTYMLLEAGVVIEGITVKVGHEVLGSDAGDADNPDDNETFSTPLATLHKFNGWNDQFLTTPDQGLVDTYIMAATKVGDGTLKAFYHDFSADEATDTVDDLGSEFDIAYSMKFKKNYNAGIKFAKYSAGDIKVDTDKLWLWVGAKF